MQPKKRPPAEAPPPRLYLVTRSLPTPQHDRGHHQVVAVLGLVDVDVARGHEILRLAGSLALQPV